MPTKKTTTKKKRGRPRKKVEPAVESADTATATKPRRKRKKLPCDLDTEFLDEVKDAVVFLQTGPAPGTTIRSFVEASLRSHLAEIKDEHSELLADGTFPQRSTAPRTGRPMDT